jgi:hypothetical protein
MPYDIPGNLKDLENKIKDLEIRINEFKNQLGTVSGDVVKSGTDEEIPVVESETVSEPVVESETVPGPVIPHEVNVNPLVVNVKAKVEEIEQNIKKNKIVTTNDLLTEEEFNNLGPEKFGTDLTVIDKFLNILNIIEKNSNNVGGILKSALNDKLKEKYITKGQQLFDETTQNIEDNIDIFCKEKEAIKAYFELYNIIQQFYSNLIKTASSYGNLYKIMKQTKNLTGVTQLDDAEFNNYIINFIDKNNNKYLKIKTNLIDNVCITGNENFNTKLKDGRGGRKTRKIKHRKTKRRGNGHKKSHKKRDSKSHKKRNSKSHKKRH